MRIFIYCFLLIFAIPHTVGAQNTSKLFEEGKQAYFKQDYQKSIAIFEELLEQYERTPLIYLYLAHSYRLQLRYNEALNMYSKLIHISPNKYPECYFYLAELYEILGSQSQAKQYYSRFIQFSKQDEQLFAFATQKISLYEKQHTLPYIDSINLYEDIGSPFFQNLSVQKISNSIVYNGLLIRNDTITNATFFSTDSALSKQLNSYFTQLNFTYTDLTPTNIQNKFWINRRNAPIYSNLPQLYSFFITKDSISEFRQITIPQTQNYLVIHPHFCIFQDSIRIFFSSNLPNGYGGMDIWYCVQDSLGNLSNPINAGKSINSSYDEICPFYNSKNATLYVSSNRPESIGGFDIFGIQINEAQTTIFQLPQPYNSSFNDLYFRIFDTIQFLTSNRKPKQIQSSSYYVNSICYSILPKPAITNTSPPKKTIKHIEPISIFFDFDKPTPHDTMNYTHQYNSYYNSRNTYIRQFNDSLHQFISYVVYKKTIQDFFENYLYQGKNNLDSLIQVIVHNIPICDSVVIELQAYTGKGGNYEYNVQLAQRRIASTKEYFINECAKFEISKDKIHFIIVPEIQKVGKQEYNTLFEIDDALHRKVIIRLKEI